VIVSKAIGFMANTRGHTAKKTHPISPRANGQIILNLVLLAVSAITNELLRN
jgi:hypothetical protein